MSDQQDAAELGKPLLAKKDAEPAAAEDEGSSEYMMFGGKSMPEVAQMAMAELMGTFLFQLFGGLASSYGLMHPGSSGAAGIAGAFGNGLALWLVIEVFGHISGGHVNPAVTIGLCATGKSPVMTSLIYICVQLLGAIGGAYTAKELVPDGYNFQPLGLYNTDGGAKDTEEDEGKACALEFLGAFLFLCVIWATACDTKSGGNKNHWAPFAIGLTITTLALTMGFFTGCAINPARAFGPAVAFENFDHQWVYWVGPISGAVTGSLFYKYAIALDLSTKKA